MRWSAERGAAMARAVWLLVAALSLGVSTAAGQERDLSSPYFDCPYINYFDSGCPELEKVSPPAKQQEQPEAKKPAVEGQRDEDDDWAGENPELLAPLFPRESLGRDAPELYRVLLTEPTLENARRFVRWYSRRMERIAEAQKLIALAGGEFLAGGAAE